MDPDLVEIFTKLNEAQSHAAIAEALARFVPSGRRDRGDLRLVLAALRAARTRVRGGDEKRMADSAREVQTAQEALRLLLIRLEIKHR